MFIIFFSTHLLEGCKVELGGQKPPQLGPSRPREGGQTWYQAHLVLMYLLRTQLSMASCQNPLQVPTAQGAFCHLTATIMTAPHPTFWLSEEKPAT